MTRIAIDMDEVMADTLGHQIDWLQRHFGTTIDRSTLPGKHLREVAPAREHEALQAWMHHGHFFADIPIMAGCRAVLEKMATRHEIWVTTAAMDYPRCCDAKFVWLQRHVPFIPIERFVFCGDKSIVRADVLIDDSPRHFANFQGAALLYEAPHNVRETRYERVRTWDDIARKFAA